MNTIKQYKAIFMGTPDFAVPSLNALIHDERFDVVGVVTQPDRPSGRGQKIVMSPIREMAQKYALKTFQPESVKNNPELIEELKALGADIIVVVAYGKILPQELIDITKIVNIHGSILPKYRGASPISQAILDGEKETGVTLMELSLGMDEGNIIATTEMIAIDRLDTTKSLSEKMSQAGAKLLIDKLPAYIEGNIIPTPQDNSQATYTKLIKKEDGAIDWSKDERDITKQIMAMSPWPSAYTQWNEKLLKLLEAEYIEMDSRLPTGQAGLRGNDKGVVAQIGGEMMIGNIRILRVQLEGRSSMTGSEFVRGYPMMVGHRFSVDS
jgi:methionyl-tRNA formyltransferase